MEAERFVLKRPFDGFPVREDFELVKEPMSDACEDGEVIVEAEFLSVDPYQRAYVRSMTPPFTMIGSTVGKVLASAHPNFPVGSTVIDYSGWVKRGRVKPDSMSPGRFSKVPDLSKFPFPKSYLLGACGMPGATAYFGLLELCQPKKGETLVVNGSAGAVGAIVGQIGKIKGCKVIGFAGTEEKCSWLKDDLGFDYAFNYKTTSVSEALKEAAPEGVNCFFDNVGGNDASAVLSHMAPRGRVAVCGAISGYNERGEAAMAPAVQGSLVFKELKMEGFVVGRWQGRMGEAIMQLAKWIGEGKIKVRETVVDWFENTPEAFIGMLKGDNIGKMVVKC